MSASSQLSRKVSSFGFSGAGFLTCYHLGVAECLIHRGVFPGSGEIAKDDILHSPVILTGVSGGALVAAAISVGIRPVDGMNAMLDVAEHTRKAGGLLDHLHPGYVGGETRLVCVFDVIIFLKLVWKICLVQVFTG